MNKLNKKTFKQMVLNNGFIILDKNGELNYVIIQINTENFKNIDSLLMQQLKDEGKYNSWISLVVREKQPPYSIGSLPIYGDSQKYVTKWFTNTPEKTIDRDLSDRGMGLLKRANTYIENNL